MIHRFCVKIQANGVMCETFGEDKPDTSRGTSKTLCLTAGICALTPLPETDLSSQGIRYYC